MEHTTQSIRYELTGRYLSHIFNLFEHDLMQGIRLDKEFANIGIADHQILRFIGASGSSVVEIAKRAGVTKQAVSKAIQSLEERGFLTRAPNVEDARAFLITFTAKGRRLYDHGLKVAMRIEKKYQKAIGAKDLERLKILMERLIASYERKEEE